MENGYEKQNNTIALLKEAGCFVSIKLGGYLVIGGKNVVGFIAKQVT